MATPVACGAQPMSLPLRGSDSIAAAIAAIGVIR